MVRALRTGLVLIAGVLALAGCGRLEPPAPAAARAIVPPHPGAPAREMRQGSIAARAPGLDDRAAAADLSPSGLHADPDPRIRLQALEMWVMRPGPALDTVTHALVDPDEAVRARAQELLEEALARR